jgi:hypothetical protein
MSYEEMDKYLESIGGLFYSYKLDFGPILDSKRFGIGEGWLPILKDMIDELIEKGWDKQIRQIKEKFGGLRVYISDTNNELQDIINKYEIKSHEFCEECGEAGETIKIYGWLYTLCENHANEKEEEIKNKMR